MKLPLALLATALLLPAALPHAAAQAPEGAVHLLDDRPADVRLGVAGSDQDPAGRWAAADLKGLDVREGPDDVAFVLTVGSLAASPEAPFAENVQYGITFRHLDQVYRVTMRHNVFVGAASSFGYLEAYNPARKAYQQVGAFQQVAQDLAAGTLSFTVDRSLLLDREGDAPHPEVPLTDWHATATGNALFGLRFGSFCPPGSPCVGNPVPTAHDAMPDEGNGTLPLVPRFGISQSGHARLLSDIPTRASNGEATTIVYQVVAQNRGARNETFALAATGVPAGWQVRLPAARLTVAGDNGTVTLPVVATIPFTHQHGTYQKFLVELRSQADPGSVGRIQLGVRYSNPPQPAGHHSTVWLHAAAQDSQSGLAALDPLLFGTSGLYMNALDADPLDAHADAPAFGCGTDLVPPQNYFCWFIPLRPQLELGLDFDLQRSGTLSLPIKTTLPLAGATLQGALYYTAPDDSPFGGSGGMAVAGIVPRPAVDVPPNSEGNILTADIVPTPDSDYIPYRKGAQLFLQVTLAATGAQPFSFTDTTSPAIQPGGILTDLPLNEYHDKVAQVFASNATLQLLAAGPQDRVTNPGKTLLFNLTLQNDGPAGTFALNLTGTHAPWARILAPGARVRLESGESVPVRVAVQVPTTADKGDTADLVLSAASVGDLNVRSLARLFATVDTARQYPDESGLLGETGPGKKSPGLELPLLGLGLLAVARGRRRR